MAENNVVKQGLKELQSSITELNRTANMSKAVKANIASILEAVVGMQATINAMGEGSLSDTAKSQMYGNVVFLQNYLRDLKKLSQEIGAYSSDGNFKAGRSGVKTQTVNLTNTKKLNREYSPKATVDSAQETLNAQSKEYIEIKKKQATVTDALNVIFVKEMRTMEDYYNAVKKANIELNKLSDVKSRMLALDSMRVHGRENDFSIDGDANFGVNEGNANNRFASEQREREWQANYKSKKEAEANDIESSRKKAEREEESNKKSIDKQLLAHKKFEQQKELISIKHKNKIDELEVSAATKRMKIRQDSEDKLLISRENGERKLTIEQNKAAERAAVRRSASLAKIKAAEEKLAGDKEKIEIKSANKIIEDKERINTTYDRRMQELNQKRIDGMEKAEYNAQQRKIAADRKEEIRRAEKQDRDLKKNAKETASNLKKQSEIQERISLQANESWLKEVRTKEKLLAIVKRINLEMIKVNPENRGALGSSIASKSGGTLNFNPDTGQIEAASSALDQLSESTGKAEKSIGFFGKAWSRITFVITAKFAYEIIGTIQKLVSSVPKLWKELEVSMSETFGILNQQGASVRKGLTDGVIELSKKYGIAAKEISDSLYEIISAQVKAADAINVLDTAIKLSLAGKGNVKDSVQALVEIMNAYDMEAKDVERIADIAFQTSKYGQLTIGQYTSNMSKIVATASIMNIPIEEVSAAIATMTLNGVHAEQAFTALNQMFMIIANPTEKAEKMMKQVGVSMKVADVRAMGLAGALAKLQPLMAFENSEEAITEIFKSRTGFKAFASLMQNNEEYVNNYINMINSSGVADAAFKEREFTLDVQTNRLKTTFEALTISIGKAFAPTQLKYITSLSDFLENLGQNTWRVVASVKALGITLATVLAIVSVQKIMGIFISIKALFTMTKVELAALKANLASATAGISIIVGLLASFVMHIVELGKHKANLKLEEKFGIKKAREELQSVNLELSKLNTAMNRFSGVQTMIEQWKELNNVQNKNPQQLKTMDAYFKGIESTMSTLGITVDNTGSKLEQIARYSAAASKEIMDFNNKILTLESRKSVLSLRAGTGETFIDASKSKEYRKYSQGVKNYKANEVLGEFSGKSPNMKMPSSNIGSKIVMDTMNNLRGDYQSISVSSDPVYLRKMYDKWNGEFDKLSKTQGVFTVETEQFRSRALEQINDNISLIIMRQQSLIKSPDIPPLKDNYGGINPAKRKGEMNPDDLIRQILGNPVEGLSVAETKANALKLIAAFKKEMKEKKAGGEIVSNEAELNKVLDELTESITSGKAEILPARMKKAIEDKLTEIGSKSVLGQDVFADVLSLYVSTLIERGNLSPDTYKGKADKASMLTIISDKAMSLLGNDEYINFLKSVNLLDPAILNDYNKIQVAYENSTDPNVKAALKVLLDTMDDFLMETISGAGNTAKESKWLSSAKSGLKQRIDVDNKPLSGAELNEYIASIRAGLLTQNRQMTQAEEDVLRDINKDAVKKDTDKSTRSRTLELFGIEDFDTRKDAGFNVAGQMVGAMQNIWSGYWDWEIQSIESQQKKKLELMDKEKNMMLANQNISAEQRAIIEERYAEKRRIMEEKNARKISALKKRQAKYEAGIDLAKGLMGIWAAYLKIPAFGIPMASALSAALTAVFATQMALINQTKFAKGGFTGSGANYRDETGQKPAGIVHANEMVFDAKSTMANLPELMSLYKHLNAGGNFNSFMMQKMNTGGYISASSNHGTSPHISGNGNSGNTNITIDLKGIRTIDDVDLSKIVDKGNRKRRYING